MLQIRCKVKSFCRLSQIYDTYNYFANSYAFSSNSLSIPVMGSPPMP